MPKTAVICPLFGVNAERYQLLEEVAARLAIQQGDKQTYLLHNLLPDEPNPIPPPILQQMTYVRAAGNPVLWQKEALNNLGARRALADGAQNLVFTDCDIIPENDQWLLRIQAALEDHDWVHCGKTVVYLNEDATQEVLQSWQKDSIDPIYGQQAQHYEFTSRSRVYIWQKDTDKSGKVGFPGGAWAVTRSAWQHYRQLDTSNIVGGGDLLHFNRLVRMLEVDDHPSYGNLRAVLFNPLLQGYAQHDILWKTGYVEGNLYHLWHGNIEDRRYITRYAPLLQSRYQHLIGDSQSPCFTAQQVLDLSRLFYQNDEGLLDLQPNYAGFSKFFEQLANYFYSRQDATLGSLNRYLVYRQLEYRFDLASNGEALKLTPSPGGPPAAICISPLAAMRLPLPRTPPVAVEDASPCGCRVSVMGNPSYLPAGSPQAALSFDGVRDGLRIQNQPSNRIEVGGKFSVAFWLLLGSTDNNLLPRFWEKRATYMCLMGDKSVKQYRTVAIEAQQESGLAVEFWACTTKLETEVWYHLVGTFDTAAVGAEGKIYINGAAETMAVLKGPWSGDLEETSTYDFFIARRKTDRARNLQGALRDFRFYQNRVLGAEEAARLYQGWAVDERNLTIHLPLSGAREEGQPQTLIYTPIIGVSTNTGSSE